jgi:hypothetical protein
MERFLKRHEDRIEGIISGFDRILFRGSLRSISRSAGIELWIASQGILMKDFRSFAITLSERITDHAKAFAQSQDRPYQHVFSPKASKEEIARAIIERDKVKRGLVCVLSCVEPCKTFRFARLSRKNKHFGLKYIDGQCLHLYFYFLDPEFGLMHVRLQTWLPFPIQVCLNGWEWLANRLDKARISYQKSDNCFLHIEDIPKAQRFMNELISRNWARYLNPLVKLANPWMNRNRLNLQPYYWSIRESEYSTDVLFKSRADLNSIYPSLLDHAIRTFHCEDVLRFLQRRVCFNGEVKSSFKLRIEGTRIKHWVQENSIKMYDKQGSVLRIEVTINNPRRWKVWRRATHKGKRCMGWIPMRKGIVDIRRRAEISRTANERYLDALSVVGEPVCVHKLFDPVAKQTLRNGRPFRPLHPIAPNDSAVLEAISRGNFLLHGFRNKDLRQVLFPGSDSRPITKRQAQSRVSRILSLLRAHGLVFKITKTNRYRLTHRGLSLTSAAIKLRQTNVLELVA